MIYRYQIEYRNRWGWATSTRWTSRASAQSLAIRSLRNRTSTAYAARIRDLSTGRIVWRWDREADQRDRDIDLQCAADTISLVGFDQ